MKSLSLFNSLSCWSLLLNSRWRSTWDQSLSSLNSHSSLFSHRCSSLIVSQLWVVDHRWLLGNDESPALMSYYSLIVEVRIELNHSLADEQLRVVDLSVVRSLSIAQLSFSNSRTLIVIVDSRRWVVNLLEMLSSLAVIYHRWRSSRVQLSNVDSQIVSWRWVVELSSLTLDRWRSTWDQSISSLNSHRCSSLSCWSSIVVELCCSIISHRYSTASLQLMSCWTSVVVHSLLISHSLTLEVSYHS